MVCEWFCNIYETYKQRRYHADTTNRFYLWPLILLAAAVPHGGPKGPQ